MAAATALSEMSPLSIGLRKVLRESRLSMRAFAALHNLGDDRHIRNWLSGSCEPSPRTVYLLVSALGEATCRGWFPHVQNLRLLLAVCGRRGNLGEFCAAAGVSRKALTAAIYDGHTPSAPVAARICAALTTTPEAIGIQAVDVEQEADDDLTQRASQFISEGGGDPRRLADVILALLDLHLAIRSGDVTPPWPHKAPEYPPFDQIIAEFERAWGSSRNLPSRRRQPHTRRRPALADGPTADAPCCPAAGAPDVLDGQEGPALAPPEAAPESHAA